MFFPLFLLMMIFYIHACQVLCATKCSTIYASTKKKDKKKTCAGKRALLMMVKCK